MTDQPQNLADALAAEIKRVMRVRDIYRDTQKMVESMNGPRVNCAPAIFMMDRAIDAGVKAAAGGDVVEMMRAYKRLEDFND